MSPVIALRDVSKRYSTRRHTVTAVDGVSLELAEGEILCLVGESGSGKSTVGRILTGLTTPTDGAVLHDGRDARSLGRRELRAVRLGVQLVQQDPFASLHPGLTVAQTLSAPLRRHRGSTDTARRSAELLEAVGLSPAASFLRAYPHELSGGQRQRVAIARALTVEPRVLVADEAVSMLDVSLRVSVLDQLRELCERQRLAVLFITHDLAVARQFASGHRIAVMQHGRIVEKRPAHELIATPEHPYTRALLSAARHEGIRGRRATDAGATSARRTPTHPEPRERNAP